MSLFAQAPCPGRRRSKDKPLLVQEKTGFHLGIAPQIKTTARHAAQLAREKYEAWRKSDGSDADSQFRCDHFTIAVGGGNTVKSEYKALLEYHARDINWLDHVRIFFLEESCKEKDWESARDALMSNFIEPLANILVAQYGKSDICVKLRLEQSAPHKKIVRRILEKMTFPIDMSGVEEAIKRGDRALALRRAKSEARRYQGVICERIGPSMAFHMIISGISKDGGIGAFATYTAELKQKKAAVIALEKASGAISVALNRGVLTAADCISLIISGNLKLKALGRFEMEDSAVFEQTVMETPIRMLRETREIAEKVYIFADDRALHFDEGLFEYKEKGRTVRVKSEVREGGEEGGVHMLLVHGFMGLYSYINLLIRLPSAWKVSALRRGKHAKKLPDAEVFPHYADALRHIILQNWRSRRPTPVCCHSMAGIISDHLLISMLKDYHDELPEFDQLKGGDRQLIEALRTGGLFHIATWAPTDTRHIRQNFGIMNAHKRRGEPLDYSGPASIYNIAPDGHLVLNSEHSQSLLASPALLEKLMNFPGTETMVNGATVAIRRYLKRKGMRKLMSKQDAPYGHRILSNRVLKKVSLYGVLKEMNAAMHDPYEYQQRHLKALDAIIKYDIPYLVIIHRDDFMVSANRHIQEHQYLQAARMAKEGVHREQDLTVPARLVLLERPRGEELAVDPINPHFLILSTTHEGGGNAREVTAAITRFVNENVARAVSTGKTRPLDSVEKWSHQNKPRPAKVVSRVKGRAAVGA